MSSRNTPSHHSRHRVYVVDTHLLSDETIVVERVFLIVNGSIWRCGIIMTTNQRKTVVVAIGLLHLCGVSVFAVSSM